MFGILHNAGTVGHQAADALLSPGCYVTFSWSSTRSTTCMAAQLVWQHNLYGTNALVGAQSSYVECGAYKSKVKGDD